MSKNKKTKEVSPDQIIDNNEVVSVNESQLTRVLDKLADNSEDRDSRNEREFAERVAKYEANVAKRRAKRAKIAALQSEED